MLIPYLHTPAARCSPMAVQQESAIGISPLRRGPVECEVFGLIIKKPWLWYSVLAVLAWGAWAILSKLASSEIPVHTMQFLFTIGTLPVAAALFAARNFKLEPSAKGIFFSVTNGVVSAIGILALFAAYRSGGNTSVVTVTTSLYPMITVVLALVILGERLTKVQTLGLGLAAVAIVMFSL
jgi:bacterial/archaeal transporter family protein